MVEKILDTENNNICTGFELIADVSPEMFSLNDTEKVLQLTVKYPNPEYSSGTPEIDEFLIEDIIVEFISVNYKIEAEDKEILFITGEEINDDINNVKLSVIDDKGNLVEFEELIADNVEFVCNLPDGINLTKLIDYSRPVSYLPDDTPQYQCKRIQLSRKNK